MKKIKITSRAIVVLFILCVCIGKVYSQDSVTLSIGDPAPPIKYSKWLQGTPVKSYDNNRLYVVEFWATWCGPCIAAMPHLSEMSEKYKDNATFIGANVWEKTGDKPYESVLPRLTNFLKSSAKKMTYNVVADNNAQELANLWLKPAGILGIPTTFIVREGKLAWIGHPAKIDSIINIMLAGTYDVAAFKKEYEKKQLSPSNIQTKYRIVADKIKAAVAAKEFDRAFLIIEEGIKQMPMFQASLQYEKLMILLKHFPESEALDFAKKMVNDNKAFGTVIATALADKDSLSKSTYLFAAETIQNGLSQQGFSANFDKLALAYSKAGDFQSAVNAEEKAVAAATLEVKDGKYEGYVFDFTIKEYEETLKQYKKALKKQK
jgi:thiol-disulfide isomerase/thioredoxin